VWVEIFYLNLPHSGQMFCFLFKKYVRIILENFCSIKNPPLSPRELQEIIAVVVVLIVPFGGIESTPTIYF
jgi:hypothetical protein